jgi:hypothetical protein
MVLIRYLIWERQHVCLFVCFSCRMLSKRASCQSDWWFMLMLGQSMMLTCELPECPDNSDRKAVLGLCSWPTFDCLYPRLDKLPCFKLLDLVGQRIWSLWKLPSKPWSKREVMMTLLSSLMWPVTLTQSWTGLESNPILEITVFTWKAGSGYF